MFFYFCIFNINYLKKLILLWQYLIVIIEVFIRLAFKKSKTNASAYFVTMSTTKKKDL